MKPPRAQEQAINRLDASRLLRAARASGRGKGCDAVDWAFAALPESRAACRLKIACLLADGDYETADGLIARGLLARPDDVSLMQQRVECLLGRGLAFRASVEVKLLLRRRPEHGSALAACGRVAAALGNWPRAIELLQSAAQRLPEDDSIRCALVRALLAGGRASEAAAEHSLLVDPPVMLSVAALRAQSRLLEAAELLEASLARNSDDRQALLCELISVLEETGNWPRLQAVVERIDSATPKAAIRAARSWLMMGAFRHAATAAAKVLRRDRLNAEALAVLIVSAMMLGRARFAGRALKRLRACCDGPIDRVMIDPWRRAMGGRLMIESWDARLAGADPSASRLRCLLQSAAEVFQDELGRRGGRDGDRLDLMRRRNLCLAALGGASPAAGAAAARFAA
jgi:tetratricopeptide (TPR) repeat protein